METFKLVFVVLCLLAGPIGMYNYDPINKTVGVMKNALMVFAIISIGIVVADLAFLEPETIPLAVQDYFIFPVLLVTFFAGAMQLLMWLLLISPIGGLIRAAKAGDDD